MDREGQRNRRRPSQGSETDHRGRESQDGRKKRAAADRAERQSRPANRKRPAAERTAVPAHRRKETQAEQSARKQRQIKRRKRQKKTARWERRNREAQRRPVKPLARRTLLLKLTAVLAVVAALTIGLTIFFKVKNVRVSGNQKYTVQEIIAASGIENGESLLTLGKFKIAAGIKEELHYVSEVQVGIKLPDTVNIDIVERSASYAVESASGGWWIMDEAGTLLEQTEDTANYICLMGVRVSEPVAGQVLSQVLEQPAEDDATGSQGGEGSAADKAAAAMEIMAALSESDRDGGVTVINVSELYNLQILYADAYQILLSGPADLSYKVRYMSEAVESLVAQGYRSGILDLSFREDGEAIFTPQ